MSEAVEPIRRVRAVHPHWSGHLVLSEKDHSVIHETIKFKGKYALYNEILTIFWDLYGPETFIGVSGVYIFSALLPQAQQILAKEGKEIARSTLNRKRTAVITDATSAGFHFPRWKKYYGNLFGMTNLHVVTYAGMRGFFEGEGVGNIWEVKDIWSNRLSTGTAAGLTSLLLNTYDVVLRTDVDEFLVPDPLKYSDLADFVEKNTLPYVTAEGIDVLELHDDPVLDSEKPILIHQRRYGMRSTALNKTLLTTRSLKWANGFHGCNVFPRFAGLYNFHMKRVDIKGAIDFHAHMLASVDPESKEHEYFRAGIEYLKIVQRGIKFYARTGEETAEAFNNRYLETVSYDNAADIYHGRFIEQNFMFRIDDAFGVSPMIC